MKRVVLLSDAPHQARYFPGAFVRLEAGHNPNETMTLATQTADAFSQGQALREDRQCL